MSEGKTRQEIVMVGTNQYIIETAIDQAAWQRIMDFTEDVMSKIDRKITPDRRLLLAWLNLVYGLDKRCSRLKDMAESEDRELNS